MGIEVLIAEAKDIQKEYPEFAKAFNKTRAAAAAKAKELFNLEPGGMFAPGARIYETTIRPRFLQIGTLANVGESWATTLGTPAWTSLLNNDVISNVVLGIQGFYMTGVIPTNRIQGMRIIVGSSRLPIIWLEGAVDLMEEPCVVFKEGLVVPPQSPLDVRATWKYGGAQSLQPFGVAFVKQHIAVAESPASV